MRVLAIFISLAATCGAVFMSYRVFITFDTQRDCKRFVAEKNITTEYHHRFIWEAHCFALMPDGRKISIYRLPNR